MSILKIFQKFCSLWDLKHSERVYHSNFKNSRSPPTSWRLVSSSYKNYTKGTCDNNWRKWWLQRSQPSVPEISGGNFATWKNQLINKNFQYLSLFLLLFSFTFWLQPIMVQKFNLEISTHYDSLLCFSNSCLWPNWLSQFVC